MTKPDEPDFISRLFAERDAAKAAIEPRPTLGEVTGSTEDTTYGLRALAGEIDRLAATPEGGRDDQANTAALKLGQLAGGGELTETTVREALAGVVESWGYPNGNPFTRSDVERWMRGGYTFGLRNPRRRVDQDAALDAWLGAVPTGAPITDDERDTDWLVVIGPRTGRRLNLTSAADVELRPVRWLWSDRIPLGSLTLLGGREGIGKSTVAYTIAAQITCGTLPGAYNGTPRAVIVAATEDSWSHTIAPRLKGAGADLSRVYRVNVTTAEDVTTELSLPVDTGGLIAAINEYDAALVLLDPLMSRIGTGLDTHKDSDVREALEPLVAVAEQTDAAVLGIIHVSKSSSTDPLTTLMGSRAFAAVARAVLFVMVDPDDDGTRLLGQAKSNLGRLDVPTLRFRIEPMVVQTTAEGDVVTGVIVWTGESNQSISAVLEATSGDPETRTATSEAADWLGDYLTVNGGMAESADIKRAGSAAGHSAEALKRARRKLAIEVSSTGYPRRTSWALPGTQPPANTDESQSGQQSGQSPGGDTQLT